jgi:ATP-dependent RNA helicase DeaD
MSEELDRSKLTFEGSESPALGWADLQLSEKAQAAMARMGFKEPTEVQQQAIPRVHAGSDVVVQAKTGSGKTLAFGLPILEKLDPTRREVQALVLTPTRELALQVSEEIAAAGELGNKSVAPIFGGASMTRQIELLNAGAQIVVGTPGRILDHLNRRTLSLSGAWMVVLDEADEMLDKGFLPDVMKILDYTPREKQTMLFSATVPDQIQRMAQNYCNNPEVITIGKAGLSINYDIEHSYYRVQRFHKFMALVNILHATPHTKVLIFCNQKSDVEGVAKYLHEEGFGVGFLNGDLSQAVRQKVLNMFKDSLIDVMVATDVAARGIDIFGVSHVINFDVPDNKERYVHRTGRTGRAGRKGKAISLVTPADLLAIGTISRNMGVTFKELSVPTKEEVDARARLTFIERVKAMEADGYPEDLALFADELVENVDPYTISAGLMLMLRQRGWDFDYGYDLDNPEHKERLFIRPALVGIKEDERARRFDEGGGRPRSGGRPRDGERSRERSERPPRRDEKSSRAPRRAKPDSDKPDGDHSRTRESASAENKLWLSIDLGRGEHLQGPGDLVALVCQTAGVKKKTIGKVSLGENSSDFQVDADVADAVVEGFAKRKKEPFMAVTRKS